ncbi:unnamed protein product [Caenorhabditis auriculariae]|uniref:Uncharacterized protein n=1 Tax=Caenorhabditis auriculariae TaxID=2777116 RepID=A0A8S1H090_9PELO|nr:unnamed protein product [Caenorhabditis auriculariae]
MRVSIGEVLRRLETLRSAEEAADKITVEVEEREDAARQSRQRERVWRRVCEPPRETTTATPPSIITILRTRTAGPSPVSKHGFFLYSNWGISMELGCLQNSRSSHSKLTCRSPLVLMCLTREFRRMRACRERSPLRSRRYRTSKNLQRAARRSPIVASPAALLTPTFGRPAGSIGRKLVVSHTHVLFR